MATVVVVMLEVGNGKEPFSNLKPNIQIKIFQKRKCEHYSETKSMKKIFA